MSEEDAALFWEIDNHPTPAPGDSSVESVVADGTVPVTEEIVPEITTVTRSVPNEKPQDPRCTGVYNRPVSDSQDTARTGLLIQLAWPACRRVWEPRWTIP